MSDVKFQRVNASYRSLIPGDMTGFSFDETTNAPGLTILQWIEFLDKKKSVFIKDGVQDRFYLSYFVVMDAFKSS